MKASEEEMFEVLCIYPRSIDSSSSSFIYKNDVGEVVQLDHTSIIPPGTCYLPPAQVSSNPVHQGVDKWEEDT